jgi:glycosyltransferase involved in cell wall biosynthesis
MTSRATVVHLITKLELGGAQENTLHTAAHLDRARFDVGLWSGPGGMLDAEAAAVPALDLRTFPSLRREVHPVADGRAFFDLVRALRGERHAHAVRGGAPRAFILHTHSSKAGILGRAAGRAAGVPIVVHSIHGFGFHDGQDPRAYALFLNAERAAAHATDAFISVSYANLAEARAKGVVLPSQPAVVVRSGFDIDRFYADSLRGPALRAELGLAADDEVLVAVANLKPQKDPLTLIRALPAVLRERPRVVLLYAGDGELRPEVEAEVARLGLGERVAAAGLAA